MTWRAPDGRTVEVVTYLDRPAEYVVRWPAAPGRGRPGPVRVVAGRAASVAELEALGIDPAALTEEEEGNPPT